MARKNGRLSIKNYDKLQHYKDRNPPWIKLATDTFQDYEFGCLQDDSKLLALCCWTLASRSEERDIPYDLRWIKSQCNLTNTTEENLKELIDQGFLITDSEPLAICYQDAISEGETEGETEGESPPPPSPPNSGAVIAASRWSAPELINYFNQKCGASHSSTDKRNIYYFQKAIDYIVKKKSCTVETAQNYVREIIDSKSWDIQSYPGTKALLSTTFDLNKVNDVIGTLKNGKFVAPEEKQNNSFKNKSNEQPKPVCKTCNKNPLQVIGGVCADECADCAQNRPWCKCAKNRTIKKSDFCKECHDKVKGALAVIKNFKNLSATKINDTVQKSIDNAQKMIYEILGKEKGDNVFRQEGLDKAIA